MKCKNCKRDIPENSLYCNWCGKYQLKEVSKAVTVPSPVQLASGKWRIQLRKEGISVTRNTADACRKAAIAERKKWAADEAAGLHVKTVNFTVRQVIDSYIDAKRPVLSSSTIRGYNSVAKFHFTDYLDTDVRSISPQEIVNADIADGYSSKSVKNAWSLLNSALNYAGIEHSVPTLPRNVPAERHWLTYDQIQVFLKAIEGQRCEFGALLALHSLRTSELLGLRYLDYDRKNKIIHIRGALIKGESGPVRSELNKNDTSRRDVPVIIPRLTEFLNKKPSGDYYVSLTEIQLYRDINLICKANDLPETGIHGLRHSFASLAYHLEWKKMSTMTVGGWKNSKILDEIYTHNADLNEDIEKMVNFYRE